MAKGECIMEIISYFEMGRTEMLRAQGYTYKAFEDEVVSLWWSLKQRVGTWQQRNTMICSFCERMLGKYQPPVFVTHELEKVRKRIIATGEIWSYASILTEKLGSYPTGCSEVIKY